MVMVLISRHIISYTYVCVQAVLNVLERSPEKKKELGRPSPITFFFFFFFFFSFLPNFGSEPKMNSANMTRSSDVGEMPLMWR